MLPEYPGAICMDVVERPDRSYTGPLTVVIHAVNEDIYTSHFMICKDGSILQCAPLSSCAIGLELSSRSGYWPLGVSPNEYVIEIGVVKDDIRDDLTNEQYATLCSVLRMLCARFSIPRHLCNSEAGGIVALDYFDPVHYQNNPGCVDWTKVLPCVASGSGEMTRLAYETYERWFSLGSIDLYENRILIRDNYSYRGVPVCIRDEILEFYLSVPCFSGAEYGAVSLFGLPVKNAVGVKQSLIEQEFEFATLRADYRENRVSPPGCGLVVLPRREDSDGKKLETIIKERDGLYKEISHVASERDKAFAELRDVKQQLDIILKQPPAVVLAQIAQLVAGLPLSSKGD